MHRPCLPIPFFPKNYTRKSIKGSRSSGFTPGFVVKLQKNPGNKITESVTIVTFSVI